MDVSRHSILDAHGRKVRTLSWAHPRGTGFMVLTQRRICISRCLTTSAPRFGGQLLPAGAHSAGGEWVGTEQPKGATEWKGFPGTVLGRGQMSGSGFLPRRQISTNPSGVCLGPRLGALRAGRGEVIGLRLWVLCGLESALKSSRCFCLKGWEPHW